MSNDFANLEVPSVQARVDPSSATLGDVLRLSVDVSHVQALAVDNPDIPKTLGTFEVIASTRLPAEFAGDHTTDHFLASLQNFATGPQLLPGIEIPYHDPMGKTHSVKSPEVTVTIHEVPPGPKDKGDIRGLKGVIGPTAWSPWWWVLLGAIVIGGGIYAWIKRKKMMQGPPPPPPIPADITAMEKLHTLGQNDWLATGKTKEYYSAISDILREYLEKGFDVMALERTTSELMRDLRRKQGIGITLQSKLQELLEACDLVKFAKYRPDASEGNSALVTAVEFVESTRAALRKDDEEFVPKS